MVHFDHDRQMLLRNWMMVVCMCLVISMAVLCGAGSAWAEKQVFQFQPATGTTFIQTLLTTQVQDLGEYGQTTETSEIKAKVTITKTDTGYSVVTAPLSITMRQDGVEIDNPLIPLMLGITVTYELDADGQLIDVHGYENLSETIKELFSEEVVSLLEPVMNKDVLVNREATDWMGRFGIFIGQEYKPGDLWTFRNLYNLAPGMDVTYYSTIGFGEEKMIRNQKCVQIISHYNTDPTALTAFLEGIYENAAEAFGEEVIVPQKVSDVSISGEGERWMDPSTMLVYQETEARTITVKMVVENIGEVTTAMRETKVYSFEYLP